MSARKGLEDLLRRIDGAAEGSAELEGRVWCALNGKKFISAWDESFHASTQVEYTAPPKRTALATRPGMIRRFTRSPTDAFALVEQVLPGFFVSCGLCALSGHASIGPDYNGPHGDRLKQEWPEGQFHDGFDADLEPGDGIHRVCLAILHCVLQALIDRSIIAAIED